MSLGFLLSLSRAEGGWMVGWWRVVIREGGLCMVIVGGREGWLLR